TRFPPLANPPGKSPPWKSCRPIGSVHPSLVPTFLHPPTDQYFPPVGTNFPDRSLLQPSLSSDPLTHGRSARSASNPITPVAQHPPPPDKTIFYHLMHDRPGHEEGMKLSISGPCQVRSQYNIWFAVQTGFLMEIQPEGIFPFPVFFFRPSQNSKERKADQTETDCKNSHRRIQPDHGQGKPGMKIQAVIDPIV